MYVLCEGKVLVREESKSYVRFPMEYIPEKELSEYPVQD